MDGSLEALRAYFACRNEAWVSGQTKSLMEHLSEQRDRAMDSVLPAPVHCKQRAMFARKKPLVRAHTRIRVIPSETGNAPLREPKNRPGQSYLIRENVLWVYQDGLDYRVEGRVIWHKQRWIGEGKKWKLLSNWESSEQQLASIRMAARMAEVEPAQGTTIWRSSSAENTGEDISPHTASTGREKAGETAGEGLVPTPEFADGSAYMTLSNPFRSQNGKYDRLGTLRYADLWWDGFNGAYPRLRDDCTNFISQCLHAGHVPMVKRGSRAEGWWIAPGAKPASEQWSYSWATSNSLRRYVHSIGGESVRGVENLRIGDVIFYDWDGTGRYHHSTVITDFDEAGDPLVNAHTDASYHRHYLYQDSRAWTPQTRYDLVHLPDTLR